MKTPSRRHGCSPAAGAVIYIASGSSGTGREKGGEVGRGSREGHHPPLGSCIGTVYLFPPRATRRNKRYRAWTALVVMQHRGWHIVEGRDGGGGPECREWEEAADDYVDVRKVQPFLDQPAVQSLGLLVERAVGRNLGPMMPPTENSGRPVTGNFAPGQMGAAARRNARKIGGVDGVANLRQAGQRRRIGAR
ncbi:hypothetical protein GWK47_021041 [Chionoecetes opilio]|uniref:Uncharacterized protein n=1 Tax=Chionoecetes opilio TaxID=41210 RepID=A0A8J4XPA9_CHIOP|nr:hypothetical protein GWK47_021041 [Chionoecetes opilio]